MQRNKFGIPVNVGRKTKQTAPRVKVQKKEPQPYKHYSVYFGYENGFPVHVIEPTRLVDKQNMKQRGLKLIDQWQVQPQLFEPIKEEMYQ